MIIFYYNTKFPSFETVETAFERVKATFNKYLKIERDTPNDLTLSSRQSDYKIELAGEVYEINNIMELLKAWINE